MSLCIHCDQDVLTAFYNEDTIKDGPFCCRGCLTVYNVIHAKGLAQYYEIKKNASFFKKRAPVEIKSAQYSFLDDPEFLQDYSYFSNNNNATMEFYLEGIHCLACLWIIEKIPEFVRGVASSKLNMSRSVVSVVLKSDGKFSNVAYELENLGYRPHPLKLNQDSQQLKIKEERSALMRIGIAGAASGNIMLYAISLYAGAGPEYAGFFNFLTVLFAVPVLSYCAFPFYRNSWLALKNKSLSIDVPISLALVIGGVMGVYNLINGINENYFDSLSALVFLLLISRYFLKAIQEKGLGTTDLHFFYQGESILRVDEYNFQLTTEIHPKFIKLNDLLKIAPMQIIPADGVVVLGESYLNNSLLTGESDLQKVSVNDEVFSGTMNMGTDVIIKVSKINKDTRLGKILRSIENGWGHKSKIIDITNLISKFFVAVVFMLSILLFILNYKNGNTKYALENALTLLIVTCPCALAIATPLAFIRTLSKSAQKGIIIKDDLVIEKLARVKNVFIDKTGTITENSLKISSFNILQRSTIEPHNIIYNLETHSTHPLAMSLKNYIKPLHLKKMAVSNLKETTGIGVSGIIEKHFYEIKNHSIFEDNQIICTFETSDTIRKDAKVAIEKLRDHQVNIQILSGDKEEYVQKIAREVGLKSTEYQAKMSPEKKSQVIKESKHSLMVGDGANDAIALSYADTGIAVFGAMDISLRAADVYLSLPGLIPVADLITISKETMKVIYRNLVLSLFYNSLSVILAFAGYISPLTAAIIMPISSLSVLISTLIGTKKLRTIWK